jgi:hypothetical protein
MTTLFVLMLMWSTGSANNPVSFSVVDKPFRSQEQCERRAKTFASEDLMAHSCYPVPVPLKESPA